MVYSKFSVVNNGICGLDQDIDENAVIATLRGNYGRLPASNFVLKFTTFDTDGETVLARENIYVTTRTGAIISGLSRAYEPVPIDDSAATNIQQALPFDAGATVELVISAKVFTDVQDEVTRLETAKFNKAGGALTGAINQAKGTNIASATTTNIGAATGDTIHITGTTTITAFDTVQAGTIRHVVFDAALTLTHNAVTLFLGNAGNNVTTAPNDCATFMSEGSGNWRMLNYALASGQPLVVSSPEATKKTYTAGETISAGEHVRMGVDSIVEVSNWFDYVVGGDLRIGYDTTNEFGGQSFTTLAGPTGKQLKSLTFAMYKTGTPTGNLTCKIYSNTGSTLIGTSSNTIAESGLGASTGPTKVTFTFAAGVSLSNSTVYYVRIEDDRANSTSNYSSICISNGQYTAEYAGGQAYSINSSNSWTAQPTYDLPMQVNINYNETLTRVYKTCAFYQELCDAVGAADSAGTAGNSMTVDTDGVNDNQTVVSGSKYYLSDTPGAISTTPGTNRVEVGTGDGTTRIRLAYLKDFRPRQFLKMYKSLADATVVKKYFHGLGRIPRYIEFNTSGQNNSQTSRGFYDVGRNQQFAYYFDGSAVGAGEGKVLQLNTLASGQRFVISAVDADSFTGTWTKAGTPTQVFHVVANIE